MKTQKSQQEVWQKVKEYLKYYDICDKADEEQMEIILNAFWTRRARLEHIAGMMYVTTSAQRGNSLSTYEAIIEAIKNEIEVQ